MTRKGARCSYDKLNINAKLATIEQWYREGKFDDWVARQLGVSERTLYNWLERGNPANKAKLDEVEATFGELMGDKGASGVKSVYDPKYTPFFEARERGKAPANEKLENRAWELALGEYEHEEVAIGWSDGVATEYRYRKRLPPNANLLWRLMVNRMPEKYTNRQEVVHSGGIDSTHRILANVPDEELARIKQIALLAQNRPLEVVQEEEVEEPIDEGDFDG